MEYMDNIRSIFFRTSYLLKENTYAFAGNVLRIYEPPYTPFYRQADKVVCLMYITFSERSFDAHVSKA